MFENLIGQTLVRYEIVRKTGEDSLGELFQAYDPTLQREFTVRVIAPSVAERSNFSEDFSRLAREAAGLDHPNLIEVYDFGHTRDLYYLVLEYIPGDDLRKMLDDLKRAGKWLLLQESVQTVIQLALALEYVRSQGAQSRLPVPRNVKIKPVQSERLPYLPVLTDVGLNRQFADTPGGAPEQDAAYLSPEAALGRNTDSRSDVYSLGVLLFELATGQLPFPVHSLDEAVRYHTRQPLPPPNSIRPDLPEPLEKIIIRALEKNPQARYESPAALANELEQVAEQVKTVRTPPPAMENAVSLLVPYRQSLVENPPEPARKTPDEPAAETAANPRHAGPGQMPVEVILENAQLSVEPGGTANTRITLINQGDTQGRFRIIVEGVPSAWLTVNPSLTDLEAGQRADINLTIRPPRSSQSRAGRYPLTIRVANQQAPGRFVQSSATLTVGAFAQFGSELYTRRLLAGQTGQVAVTNQGNTQGNFAVSFRDPDGDLYFTPPDVQMRLAEGQTGVAEFQPRLNQLHWFGSERLHPFIAQVSSGDGEAQTHSGSIISRPFMPGWLLGLVLFTVLCFSGALALYFGRQGLQANRATATLVAAQTGTAVAVQNVALAETATAEFLANANQATVEAVTATATWLQADTDGDGLTNQQELDLGTSPDNPDTDGDGLSDGEEAKLGTDPLRPDTDGDGIPDGKEVQMGLNPLNPDTDGDGIPDGQDQNPLETSTPTPNLDATAQAAATQTAAVSQATQISQEAANATATAAAAAATAQALVSPTATVAVAPSPTVTPSPARDLVYIFLTANREAQDYQQMLQSNGYQVDVIPNDAVPITDFSAYQAILIGPDTGSQDIWGDAQGQQANKLIASGLPIVGLGEGGYAFFGRANLNIGYDHGTIVQGTDVEAIDPTNPIWTTPNPVTVPANRILSLYTNARPEAVINAETPGTDIFPIGRLPGQATQYSLIRQGDKYFLWGFSAGPRDMTATGQQVFLNLLDGLLPK